MNTTLNIGLIPCAAAGLGRSIRAAGLSARLNTSFETDGAIDYLQPSGGGFGAVNAPLVTRRLRRGAR